MAVVVGHVGDLVAVGNDAAERADPVADVHTGQQVIVFTADEWAGFIDAVKAGRLDLDDDGELPAVGLRVAR
jgi:hypothetical protein